MSKKLFNVVMTAQRFTHQVIEAKLFLAANKDEAVGIGIKYLQSTYPMADGWLNYRSVADDGLDMEIVLKIFKGEAGINNTSVLS